MKVQPKDGQVLYIITIKKSTYGEALETQISFGQRTEYVLL